MFIISRRPTRRARGLVPPEFTAFLEQAEALALSLHDRLSGKRTRSESGSRSLRDRFPSLQLYLW